MASIDHSRFVRILERCSEIAKQSGLQPIVAVTYNDSLKSAADAFRAAHAAVAKKEMAWGKENGQALEALRSFDRAYTTARAAAKAFVPAPRVPETLKSLPTDTDKKLAVETLLDVIDDHPQETWAKTLLEGEFGLRAPVVVKELEEAIEANKQLSAARTERAKLYGPAYEKYLPFKRVVRSACGSTSREYQRIHLRGSGTIEDDDAPKPSPTPNAPTPPAPPAPPNP